MEIRQAKLLATKGGSGSSTFRATLPTSWVREMGLSEDNREMMLVFNENSIMIKSKEGYFNDLVTKFKKVGLHLAENESEEGYHIIEYYDDKNFTGNPRKFATLEKIENHLMLLEYNEGMMTDDEFHKNYDFELED